MQVLVHQPSVGLSSEAQSSHRDVWAEEDLPTEPPAGYRISSKDYKDYRAYLIGRQVKPARFSQAELSKAGFSGWKAYQLHCSLGNY